MQKEIVYFGQSCVTACDEQCHKAWGINNRPRRMLSDGDPDDYVYLADHEVGFAPVDPGTYEGGHAKPRRDDERPNKWCVRECERSALVDKGKPLVLPDFDSPRPNIPRRDASSATTGRREG